MQDTLEQIHTDLKKFKGCDLYQTCIQPVMGTGNPKAEIIFIGEAPGAEEDKQGIPFIGRSGKFLNELLEKSGIQRSNVYITNIVKFRPPSNRDPSLEEKDQCFPFLKREILCIKPLILATLGRHSMNYFFPDLSISESHGKLKIGKGFWNSEQVYFPLYHPAVGLYNPGQREIMLTDMQNLAKLLKKIKK